ncbi:hypothetical protein RhiirA4_445865 [Rhizophagus irregularis]|uniref:Uncharacterized protein n=1 Tax=Rhizophagus irregularis TaxID=588596 RepID=A0A2I1GS80_9GLOM|nr:hypothetical protein RhiirA4_445865 [Rhizophagus irregularis]
MSSRSRASFVRYVNNRKYHMKELKKWLKGCKTLRDSIKDYIQEETLDRVNKSISVAKFWKKINSLLPLLKIIHYPVTQGCINRGLFRTGFKPVYAQLAKTS